MKTLELKLKKDVLIVDGNDFEYYELFKEGIYFKLENGDRDFIEGEFKFLCKGSDLTEEMASELVEVDYSNFQGDDEIYELKKNYIKDTFVFMSFEESFISAVESKEKFWLENPIEIIERGEDTEHNRVLNQNKWQEAEEKTFKNPLLFVKND